MDGVCTLYLVWALCDGNPVQHCYQCGDQVTVVDAVVFHASNPVNNYQNLDPALILDDGYVYNLCDTQRCCHEHIRIYPFIKRDE